MWLLVVPWPVDFTLHVCTSCILVKSLLINYDTIQNIFKISWSIDSTWKSITPEKIELFSKLKSVNVDFLVDVRYFQSLMWSLQNCGSRFFFNLSSINIQSSGISVWTDSLTFSSIARTHWMIKFLRM